MANNVGFYLITMQAQRQNLRYPGYVWITQGWYSDQWWTEGDVNCTGEDLEFFVEGAIAISHFPTASNETEATDIEIVSLCLDTCSIIIAIVPVACYSM